MAAVEYWIQLENRPWDVCPHEVDRIDGQTVVQKQGVKPTDVQLRPGPAGKRTMFLPLNEGSVDQPDGTKRWKVIDALILRRYKPPQQPDQSDAWTVPDDRKLNPWDLNEPDPTENGTMGTIPGPVIECDLATSDSVVVHFRNMDKRILTPAQTITITIPGFPPFIPPRTITFQIPEVLFPIEKRVHSLHPHGFVFHATSDGAYPLSPPDPSQPIPASEAAAWAGVPGFSGTLKKGDRVPPGGTFTYRWNTVGWPTTAGVWLYHDHSICDMDNVELGAIGIIVIHNSADTQQEVDIRAGDANDPSKLDPTFLPGGSPNGSPVQTICFPIPPLPRGFPFREVRVLPGDLEGLGVAAAPGPSTGEMAEMEMSEEPKPKRGKPAEAEHEQGLPVFARTIRRGNLLLELDEKLQIIRKICISHYRTPPTKALYLQLFHTLSGAPGMMMINGRTFLGNTPTMVAGPNTRMRFGVVGMGSQFHTFHIHGHRWIIPGPHGNNPGAIQGSVMDTPVSQFEDTRTFGPANSFVFTIQGQPGSFMRAGGPGPTDSIGEWHMHCHVLQHMMTGMMGSLLIVNGGELAFSLPVGVPCEMPQMGGGGGMPPGGGGAPLTATVRDTTNCKWKDDVSGGPETTIKVNGTVSWVDTGACPPSHTIEFENVPPFSPPPANTGVPGSRSFGAVGDYGYHCGVHGGSAKNKTGMYGIIHVVA